MPLIECVPNVSEGRRRDVIERMASSVVVPGVRLLDRSSDPSHNRTVFTLVGDAASLQRAILELFSCAIGCIDLRQHHGVHPRMGAVDVVPFVPLQATTMDECVALAHSTAALVWNRYRVPAYFYEAAALRVSCRNLADVRDGGFEQLATRMRDEAWRPDVGDPNPHPSAGATAFGARQILIAYNVNLASSNRDEARRIARVIRSSNGGLPCLKAIGTFLEHRGVAQVSMNLTDYRQTSMRQAYDAVAREAAIAGVEILESEIIGLVPENALPPDPVTTLKLPVDQLDRTIEKRLRATKL